MPERPKKFLTVFSRYLRAAAPGRSIRRGAGDPKEGSNDDRDDEHRLRFPRQVLPVAMAPAVAVLFGQASSPTLTDE